MTIYSLEVITKIDNCTVLTSECLASDEYHAVDLFVEILKKMDWCVDELDYEIASDTITELLSGNYDVDEDTITVILV